jgi:hypothetical protein
MTSFFLQEVFLHVSCAPRSHHSWEDSSTTRFHQCLTLRRANEYSHVAKAFQPMMRTILSKDTIVALH